MALLSLHSASPCSLWKGTERQVPKLSSPFFLAQSSPLHHHSQAPSSSSSPGTLCFNKVRNRRSSISMSTQMEAPATAADHTRKPEPDFSDIPPTFVEFTVSSESFAGLEADYERVSATWPVDLATTTDYAKIEQFVSSAQALLRRWLPQELVSRLERYIYDPEEVPALVIRGLPIDKDMPPTVPDAHVGKVGKCMTEAWLVGIARIVGQVYTMKYLIGSRTGMGLLVRELYATADKEDVGIVNGSRMFLDIHVDFFQTTPDKFPHVIGFIAVRGDPNKEGKTELCHNRKLYRMLDPADIQVLRTEKITWDSPKANFSQYVIQGSETNPMFSLFEEDLPGFGGFGIVQGSPEARAAYKRVKETAATLAEGVLLGSGDLLLVNQKKLCHGRSPYRPKYDGNDRWLQRTYINTGGFWENGLVEWPSRAVPFP